MRTRLGLAILVALLAVAPAWAADTSAQAAAIGRVVFIDTNDGFVVADFPTGRRLIGVDKREAGRYIPGDEIAIDSFGRPLPPATSR